MKLKMPEKKVARQENINYMNVKSGFYCIKVSKSWMR